MKRNFYHQRRRFGPEQLETWLMLAGDVTVSVNAGNLSIVGDNDGNHLAITATANAGEYLITGTFGTTVNGGAGPVVASGVTGDVTIQMHDEMDVLEFDTDLAAIQFPGDLIIEMGSEIISGFQSVNTTGDHNLSVAGSLSVTGFQLNGAHFENTHVTGHFTVSITGEHNDVELLGGSIGGDVTIDGTEGSNSVRISSTVAGDVHIDLNGSNDRISLVAGANSPLHIGGSVFVNLDSDRLDVMGNNGASTAVVAGDFVITGSGGALSFISSTVSGHLLATLSGESSITGALFPIFNQIGGNMVVDLSAGSGSANLLYFNVAHDLVVRGGNGVEDVRLNNVRAGNSLLIDTGAGNDILWVDNSSAFGEAAVLAGAGSDYLRVGNFSGARSLFVDTAAGFDLVNVSYASFGQNLYVWLGGDSDQGTVYAASAHYLSVDAGAGFDAMRIEYSAADHLFASMGEGNDSLAVLGSLVRRSALFDGGAGHDLLLSRGNLLTGLAQQNFEIVSS